MKRKQQSTYDYSKLVETAKQESQYESFSTFVDEKIHKIREEHFDGEVRRFNRSTLADMIGIDSSTLTKIINGSQTTRKRDIIIALCFALQLSESETRLALNLYPMTPLNSYNLRDLVIIQALHEKVSIKHLNDILVTHGFPQLNILRGNGKNDDRAIYVPLDSTAYQEVSVEIVPYCIAGKDSELSLHDRYRPDRYDYHSVMIIQEKGKNGPQYRLFRDDEGQYDIDIWEGNDRKLVFSNGFFYQKYSIAKECDDPGLLNEIAKLKEYTDRKARYVLSMCNDTRNFKSRFDAVNDHGQLVVYGECFGYDAPELSEYFQLEVSSGDCLFTISNTSRFLERYLGTENWMKLYGMVPSPISRSFKKLDEVPNQRWRRQFQDLLQSAEVLLDKLRARKLFLSNARAWIGIDELMHRFQVEQAFECYQPDGLPYEIIPKKDQIIGSDGKTITLDDLYRAAELEITTIEDLCAIRSHYGSLEQFLQIDVLTEQKGIIYE